MESTTLSSEAERKQEVLDRIHSMDEETARKGVDLIFDVLRAWELEYGKVADELMEATCNKLSIDPQVGLIYLRCPELIQSMEALRGGVPVKRVRVIYSLSEESRRWWHALHIVRVLLKCAGNVLHMRLMRWLGHRMVSRELHAALALLTKKSLVETYQVKGANPLQPVTWHRFTKAMAEALEARHVAE